MSKRLRNFLIAAAVLLIAGGIFSGVGLALGGMQPISIMRDGVQVLGPASTQSVSVSGSYKTLTSVDIDTDMINFRLIEGDSFRLTGAYDSSVTKVNITETNGRLVIASSPANTGLFGQNWFNFGFGFYHNSNNELTLTYPKGTNFDSASVKSDIGSLEVGDLKAKTLNVRLSTGSFNGSNITADALDVNMDIGGCTIDNLKVFNSAHFELDTGSLRLKNSSLKNLTAAMNIGGFDYTGELLGNIDISDDTGSAHIDLTNKASNLSYSIRSDVGSVTINGKSYGSSALSSSSSSSCDMTIKTNLGSVTLDTQ